MEPYRVRGEVAFVIVAVMSIVAAQAQEQEKAHAATSPVRMTVTLAALSDKRMPEVKPEDVVVKQGKERLRVSSWEPAREARAGLDLFILVDDASDTSLGSQLDDLRTFISAQPATTAVGVGYMRNVTVQIAQNFTTDHTQAAQALRLPVGSVGAFGSPYLSAISLMNGWPQHANRRALVLVTDGIDRARRRLHPRGLGTNPDVNSASTVAQRTGYRFRKRWFQGWGTYAGIFGRLQTVRMILPGYRRRRGGIFLSGAPGSCQFQTVPGGYAKDTRQSVCLDD